MKGGLEHPRITSSAPVGHPASVPDLRRLSRGRLRIRLNGEWAEAPEGETLAALLARVGIDPRRVAVERNLEIIPRARYRDTPLAEGDHLEVVHFVGGG